jgi:hypothetical protein
MTDMTVPLKKKKKNQKIKNYFFLKIKTNLKNSVISVTDLGG